MRVETEVKLRLLGSRGEAEEILRREGYVFVEEVYEKDYYYQHPCRDYAATDEALRVRLRRGASTAIVATYKGPRVMEDGVKRRLEIEIPLALSGEEGLAVADEFFRRLGFTRAVVVEKTRAVYRGGEAVVSIDTLLPCNTVYIEIEGGVDEIRRLMSLLGRMTRVVEKTYLEIVVNGCVD